MPYAIRRFDDEPFEVLFKRWKKAVEKSGVIQEYRNREYYEKPSLTRKRRKAAAVKRQQRRAEEQARHGSRKPVHQRKEKQKKDMMDDLKYS